ncbi:hypothetical protein FA95DRAFT_1483235 [Auriscalpium vulgare]|uniref:Uncharacterized protein n=1 Tax=Auriscalpium vulgare TaxID=40419 RepID=A0ACB8S9E7_9AGAM|nr:hypothetical protein FA95DRAFT_1483235 [Auriscalpium vulgare]
MDQLYSFDAILFPADGRPPHVVALMTSPASFTNPHALQASADDARFPHPEVYMDYIAENIGPRAWHYQLVEALDGMNKKFTNPYIIYFPVVSRDGMPFPVNKSVREIQGRLYREEYAWRGNLIIAKYRDARFSQMMNASMADFPILKNYLSTHGSPIKVSERLHPTAPLVPSSAEHVPSTSEAAPESENREHPTY